jgi:hypothetical protein
MARKSYSGCERRACQKPPHYSRRSVRTLAGDLGLPRSTVHQILVASHLQPHRIRTFTFSPDPDFEAKLLDIVGLYLNPPENALVLCVDEKTGIQALDRTQPRLPLSAKKPRSWTNEYVRHGTQTLLAALEIAGGQVVAELKQRRTSVNFLRFLKESSQLSPTESYTWFSTISTSTKMKQRGVGGSGIPGRTSMTRRPMLPGSIEWNVSSASSASKACRKAFLGRNAS